MERTEVFFCPLFLYAGFPAAGWDLDSGTGKVFQFIHNPRGVL